MSDWTQQGARPLVLSTASLEAFGPALWAIQGSWSANAWPISNQALFVPFVLARPMTVLRCVTWTGTVNGTTDVGVYDATGRRRVSSGPFTPATSAFNLTTLTTTALEPGAYYLALACTNNTQFGSTQATGGLLALLYALGLRQVNIASGTLPATVTYGAPTNAYTPFLAIQAETAWP